MPGSGVMTAVGVVAAVQATYGAERLCGLEAVSSWPETQMTIEVIGAGGPQSASSPP